ncbi:MAG TPA: response regulator [Gemmatimonadaceae bacterium]|jgi:DNA-binding NtrC family response regulator|nr:response regulator [Gemmatimonadaceae bacterium]
MISSSETTILLVEDDPAVRDVIGRTLARAGYTVHECATGELAIEFVRGHAGRIDLLLIDTVLGGMSGVEAAIQVLEMRPQLAVLHMSGYSRGSIFGEEDAPSAHEFIAKPFLRHELDTRIREMIGARSATWTAAS